MLMFVFTEGGAAGVFCHTHTRKEQNQKQLEATGGGSRRRRGGGGGVDGGQDFSV